MDWTNHLQEYFREELADCIKYAAIAKESTKEERPIFHDMAKEEYQHARHIYHIMEALGVPIENEKIAFENAKNSL